MNLFGRKKIVYISISVLVVLCISVGVVLSLKAIVPKNVQKDVSSFECPTGFVVIPGNKEYNTNDFCVMKYEAKSVMGIPTSQAEEKPWTDIPQFAAVDLSKKACDGCHLITESEWLTIAQDVLSVPSNWSLNIVGGGYIYSGHNDGLPATVQAASKDDKDGYIGIENSETDLSLANDSVRNSQRRTLKLSNGQIIWDFSGNASEWTDGQTTGGQPGLKNETGYSWKEWNSVNSNGFLTSNPFPGYGNPLASVWNSTQGIGRLYSNTGEDKIKAFTRGGSYVDSDNAGILSLYIGNNQTDSSVQTGFRVAK